MSLAFWQEHSRAKLGKFETIGPNEIKIFPYSISLSEDQPIELCQLAISIEPYTISVIKNQTLELCLLAIDLNPASIYFIRNQTEELCLTALKNNQGWTKYLIEDCIVIPVPNFITASQADFNRRRRSWRLDSFL